MPQNLLRAPEVAQLLNLSLSKVYALIRTGALPSVRVDSAVRVPRAELEDWIRGKTTRHSLLPKSETPRRV